MQQVSKLTSVEAITAPKITCRPRKKFSPIMQIRLPPVVHPSFGQIASMMGIIWGAACPTVAGTKHKKRQQVNNQVAVSIFLEYFHSRCIPANKGVPKQSIRSGVN